MHPQRELRRLATRKAELVRQLAVRRVQYTAAGARVVDLVGLADRIFFLWRHFAPPPRDEAARARSARPASGAGSWARWLSLLIGVARLARRADAAAPPVD